MEENMTSANESWNSIPIRWLTLFGVLPSIILCPSAALGQACQWKYSPGGMGNFHNLAVGPPLTSGLHIADFDGDKKADVFSVKAIGGGAYQWMYSPGGAGNFRNLAVGPAISELRFGDF